MSEILETRMLELDVPNGPSSRTAAQIIREITDVYTVIKIQDGPDGTGTEDTQKFRWKGAALASYADASLHIDGRRQASDPEIFMGKTDAPEMREFQDVGGAQALLAARPLHEALETAASLKGLVVDGSLTHMNIQDVDGKPLLDIQVSPDGVRLKTPGQDAPQAATGIDAATIRIHDHIETHIQAQILATQKSELHTAMHHRFDEEMNGMPHGSPDPRGRPQAIHVAPTDDGFRVITLHQSGDGNDLDSRSYIMPEITREDVARPDLNASVEDTMVMRGHRMEGPWSEATPKIDMGAVSGFLVQQHAAGGAGLTHISPVLQDKIDCLGGNDAVRTLHPMFETLEALATKEHVPVHARYIHGGERGPMDITVGSVADPVGEVSLRHEFVFFNVADSAIKWIKDPHYTFGRNSDPDFVQDFATGLRAKALDVRDEPGLTSSRLDTYTNTETRRRSGIGHAPTQERLMMDLAPVLQSDIKEGRLTDVSMGTKSSLNVWERKGRETPRPPPRVRRDLEDRD